MTSKIGYCRTGCMDNHIQVVFLTDLDNVILIPFFNDELQGSRFVSTFCGVNRI